MMKLKKFLKNNKNNLIPYNKNWMRLETNLNNKRAMCNKTLQLPNLLIRLKKYLMIKLRKKLE